MQRMRSSDDVPRGMSFMIYVEGTGRALMVGGGLRGKLHDWKRVQGHDPPTMGGGGERLILCRRQTAHPDC